MTIYKSDSQQLCVYCHQPIHSYGVVDDQQQYYHLSCYEDRITNILTAVKIDAQLIVDITQNHSAQANSIARRILRTLES